MFWLLQTVNINNKKMANLNYLTLSKTKRDFIQQHISRHLYCSICHDIFEDAVRTICGHTFCYICIQNWALVQMKCPICKNGIKGRKLQKDLIASQIVDDLIAKCTHATCQWNGAYSLLKKHQRWCEYKPKREAIQLLQIQERLQKQQIQQIQIEEITQIKSTIQPMENESMEIYCSKVFHM